MVTELIAAVTDVERRIDDQIMKLRSYLSQIDSVSQIVDAAFSGATVQSVRDMIEHLSMMKKHVSDIIGYLQKTKEKLIWIKMIYGTWTVVVTMNELISEVTSLKHSSEEPAEMLTYAESDLQYNMRAIASMFSGSSTGMEAVASLSAASKSILDSATSIRTLRKMCDDCASQLSK